MTSPLSDSLGRLAALVMSLALATAAALALPRARPAHASSLWDDAVAEPEAAARALRYAEAMDLGHSLARTALDREQVRDGLELSPSERLRAVNRAAQAFQDAGKIDPAAADPPYYLALLLTYAKLECSGCDFVPQLGLQVIEAIDAFEQRAPVDPRLTMALLIRRAVYHTRLAGLATGEVYRKHLHAALADYRTAVARTAATRNDSEVVYGNMAETLMMLGDVEEAIEQYRHALRVKPSAPVTLGLAVALDRDERGTEARSLLRELGTAAISDWEMSIASGDTFYVPEGEVFYYRALINEAFGNHAAAIESYDRFIKSRAHPTFSPRAATNRDALRSRR
jgi:tetratricopeptide (TPR) repeat protein